MHDRGLYTLGDLIWNRLGERKEHEKGIFSSLLNWECSHVSKMRRVIDSKSQYFLHSSYVLIYERILAGYWILSFLIIMLLLRGFHRCKNLSTERTITLLDSVGVIGYSILPRCLNYRVVKLHSGPEENSVRQMRKTGCQQCSSVDGGGGD